MTTSRDSDAMLLFKISLLGGMLSGILLFNNLPQPFVSIGVIIYLLGGALPFGAGIMLALVGRIENRFESGVDKC